MNCSYGPCFLIYLYFDPHYFYLFIYWMIPIKKRKGKSKMSRNVLRQKAELVLKRMIQPYSIATVPSRAPVFSFFNPPPSPRSFFIMSCSTHQSSNAQLEAVFKQKKILRSRIRKDLKAMDPSSRSQEGNILFLSNPFLFSF